MYKQLIIATVAVITVVAAFESFHVFQSQYVRRDAITPCPKVPGWSSFSRPLSGYTTGQLVSELLSRYNDFWFLICVFIGLVSGLNLIWSILRLLLWFFRAASGYAMRVFNSVLRDVAPVVESVGSDAGAQVNPLVQTRVLEAYREGSEYTQTAEQPKFQFQVYRIEGDRYVLRGQGFRHKHFLITARHVVGDDKRVAIGRDGKYVELDMVYDDKRFEDIHVQFVSADHFSSLGISSGNISTNALVSPVFASVCSGELLSRGDLSPSKVFGRITYSGSTKGGFSGAPYVLNNKILGMHIGAGGVNYGFDAGYVCVLLQNEDSYDFIEAEIRELAKKGGKKLKAKISPFSSDEIYVKYRGKYRLFDAESAAEIAHILDFSADADDGTAENALPITDVDSGNSVRASAIAEARGLPRPADGAPRPSTPVKASTSSSNIPTSMEKRMDGLESTLAQLRKALRSMQRSLSGQRGREGRPTPPLVRKPSPPLLQSVLNGNADRSTVKKLG